MAPRTEAKITGGRPYSGMVERKKKIRKGRVFSVSLRQSELDYVDQYLEDYCQRNGVELSRNELVRRAVLAHARYMRAWEQREDLSKADDGKDYETIFKQTVG